MTGKFIKVKCGNLNAATNKICGNEQNIYEKATTPVNCLVCGESLAKVTGGKIRLAEKTKVIKELD